MRWFHVPLRRAAAVVFGLGLVLALAAPSVALAANTATFGSCAPRGGSSSTVARPKISVTVYDRYGVRYWGNYSMAIDGKSVLPKITYLKAGDYRRFTLTYSVQTSLTVAPHMVSVRVIDARHRSSTSHWGFNVLALPTPPPAEMPIAGTTCTVCHAGYPAAHPMADCVACHGPNAPPKADGTPMEQYVSGDPSAHTLSCALSQCHRGGGAFPHTLGTDCTRCHTGEHEGIPAVHSAPLDTYHVSTSVACTAAGCHLSSLTKEHYLHTIGGAPLTCATCHASIDRAVRAAIDSKSTACESCHDFRTTAHAGTAVKHAASGVTCTIAGCHTGGSDVAAIHAPKLGCATCHGGTRVPTLNCAAAGCHPGGAPASHNGHPSTVTSATMTINSVDYGTHACTECHVTTELQAVHGGASSCVKCHPTPRDSFTDWNGTCEQGNCHAGTSRIKQHGSINVIHTLLVAPACTVAGCHTGGSDVAAIHAPKLGCATCHGGGKVPTLACATVGCHPDGAPTTHLSHPATITTGTITINSVDYGTHNCSECHATTELQAVHGGASSCSKCHPDPAASAKPWLGGCAQGDCHAGTSTIKMHGSVNASHTVLVAPTCTVAGCHVGGSDVAAIHAPKLGCATCHGGGKTPTLNCYASACHDPAGHGPLHDVLTRTDTCASCHAGTNLGSIKTSTGALAAKHTLCATCHAPTSSTISSATIAAAISGHHKECTACHIAVDHVAKHAVVDPARTDACVECHAGTNLTLVHDPARVTCITCHGSTDAAVVLAISLGNKRCDACHADAHQASHQWCNDCHSNLPDITAGTDPHSTFDLIPNQACSNCHGTPFVPLSGLGTSHDGCDSNGANCHNGGSMTPQLPELHNVVRTDTCGAAGCHAGTNLTVVQLSTGALSPKHSACATCHAPTSSTIPSATIAAAIAGGHTECSACHGTAGHGPLHDVLSRADTCTTCHAGTNLTAIKLSNGAVSAKHAACATCHAPSGTSTVPAATIAAAIAGHHKECAACHVTGHDFPALHAAAPASQTITIIGVTYAKQECIDCHTVLDLRTIHAGNCAACHTVAVDTTLGGSWTKGCVQGDCHKIGTALQMHKSIDTSHTTPAVALTSCGTGGASCHGTLSTSVAAIHAAYGGCVDCHAVGKTPSLVCSSCHAAHPDIYGDLHVSNLATASASFTFNGVSFGTKACSTCHTSANLMNLHTAAGACGACHPGVKVQLGGTSIWNKTCTQGTCHGATAPHPYHGTINNHAVTAAGCNATGCHPTNVAAVHSKTGCAACHATGKPALTTNCTVCHGGSGLATTVTSLASHTTLHDVLTRADTCAAAGCHVGTNLTTIQHSNGTLSALHSACATCHAPTSTKISAATIAAAIAGHHRECTACHDPAGHGPLHDVLTRSDTCVSCHAGTNLTAIKSSTGVVSAKHALCATCHAPTSTKIPAATIAAAISGSHKECSACHGTGHDLPALHAAAPANAAIVGYGGAALGTHACSECHSLDLRPLHTDCSSCHTATLSVTTTLGGAWAKGCAQGNCHAGTSTIPMHGKMAMHGMSGDNSCHSDQGGPWEAWGSITFDIGWAHQQWGYGCATCHDGRDLSNISNCVDCHGDHC